MADFNLVIAQTLIREGGATLTHDPSDPGNPSRYGISQRELPSIDIKMLTESQAKAFYKAEYWQPLCADNINDQDVAELLFNTAIDAGVKATLRLIQLTVQTQQSFDSMNEFALDALNREEPELFLANFTLAKIARYLHLCRTNPANKAFLFGWVNKALGGNA